MDAKMTTICGVVQPGFRAAGGNLIMQIPLIEKAFPEIANVHKWGTLNLLLEKMLLVLTPDHRTKVLFWNKNKPQENEAFDFLRIKIEAPEGAQEIDAWIYIAHGSEHRNTPRVHEIIAPTIDKIKT